MILVNLSDLDKTLKKYWGYTSFRNGQAEVIKNILERKNVLAMFPTGGGKSICFQIPAVLSEGCTLVVSPLVSLMKDQVDKLVEKDIQAVTIYSGLGWSEIRLIMENALKGRYKLIYISPERLISENFREYLPHLNVSILVVDEAHCISQWGFDFRPSYLRIKEVVSLLPNAVIAAFTASAPPNVQSDIEQHLFTKKPTIFSGDFYRKNLNFYVVSTENKSGLLLKLFKNFKGNALVFCDTRRETEETSRFLSESGISCDFYHAGLEREERNKRQEKWMKARYGIMACTNAFGMGVDKEDVQMVVHLSPPVTPEAYYQEAGRAGRNGKKSKCILFVRPGEIDAMRQRIEQSFPAVSDLERVYNAIHNYFGISAGGGMGVSAEFNLPEISAKYKIPQLAILNAASNIESLGFWSISESVWMPTRLRVKYNFEEVYDFKIKNEKYEPMIDILLRSYGGIFEYPVKINENIIAKRLGETAEKVTRLLTDLSRMGILEFFPRTDKPIILFMEPRSPYPVFNIKKLEPLRKSKLESLSAMNYYVQKSKCKSAFWLKYFTGEKMQNCGHCGYCISNIKRKNIERSKKKYDDKISAYFNKSGVNKAELLDFVSGDSGLRQYVRWLMDHKKIEKRDDHKYYLEE